VAWPTTRSLAGRKISAADDVDERVRGAGEAERTGERGRRLVAERDAGDAAGAPEIVGAADVRLGADSIDDEAAGRSIAANMELPRGDDSAGAGTDLSGSAQLNRVDDFEPRVCAGDDVL
jgi:hypothetical protein